MGRNNEVKCQIVFIGSLKFRAYDWIVRKKSEMATTKVHWWPQTHTDKPESDYLQLHHGIGMWVRFPWFLYAHLHLTQLNFSLWNRKSSSVTTDHSSLWNISNWWIASKKNPNSQIKLFHCRWNFIILLLIYNITSVLFQSHLAFDG